MENDILKQIRDLFMKYGIKSVTMDDISRELGISKKTLYEHYKDKADLIRQVFRLEMDKMTNCMNQLAGNSENTIDQMIAINKHLIEIRKKFPENIKFEMLKYYPEIMNENRLYIEERMRNAIKENLLLGQKQGMIRKDVDIEIIAAMQVSRSSVVDDIMRQLQNNDYETIINVIFDYHLRGVCTKKGIEYYFNKIKKLQDEN